MQLLKEQSKDLNQNFAGDMAILQAVVQLFVLYRSNFDLKLITSDSKNNKKNYQFHSRCPFGPSGRPFCSDSAGIWARVASGRPEATGAGERRFGGRKGFGLQIQFGERIGTQMPIIRIGRKSRETRNGEGEFGHRMQSPPTDRSDYEAAYAGWCRAFHFDFSS